MTTIAPADLRARKACKAHGSASLQKVLTHSNMKHSAISERPSQRMAPFSYGRRLTLSEQRVSTNPIIIEHPIIIALLNYLSPALSTFGLFSSPLYSGEDNG